MRHEQLSQEEASRLLEATFLLISQQNIAQKQRNTKSQHTPPSPLRTMHPISPLKLDLARSQTHTPMPQSTPNTANPQNSPGATRTAMTKKWSIEKSSSNSEGLDPEGLLPLVGEWKEEDSDPFNVPAPSSPIGHVLRREVQEAGQHKLPLKQEEAHENLFVESRIKDLKRDLEISSRGKICKSQEVNSQTGQVTGYRFNCKTNSDCPFSCSLVYTGNRNAKNQKLYLLERECDSHVKGCIEPPEEVAFIRLTKTLDQMQPAIATLLTTNPELKPKNLLSAMAAEQGMEAHSFIYRGLNSKSYCKAAKKYFDNMIYKIKSQMGIL